VSREISATFPKSKTMAVKAKKKISAVTEKQLIDRMEKYLDQLQDDDKVSRTKFYHMQVAVVGCMYIVNDAFGSPRKMYYSRVK
jgi:hypothetical protein